jgi:hypothetical protein
MAKVEITFSDDIPWCGFPLEIEDKLKDFLKKYSTELGDEFVDSFYEKNLDNPLHDEGDVDCLQWLIDLTISTHDDDPKIKSVLKFISKTVGDDPGFSLGYEGFSDELYEDLVKIVNYGPYLVNDSDPVQLDFNATVVGYGDEYTSCQYELTSKGWNVTLAELYVWDEEYEEYCPADAL